MAKKRPPAAAAVVPDANTTSGSSEYIFGAVMLVIAALMPWYFELPLIFNIFSPDFNPLIVAPAIFAGIGVVVLFRTARTSMQARRFGTAILATQTARVGAPYEAVIRTTTDVTAKGDFVGVLRCLRKVSGGDDFEGRSTEKVIWRQRVTAPGHLRSSQGIPLRFRIEPGLPRSGSGQKGSGSHVRWVLTVTAPTPGLNFHASFAVEMR